MAPAVEANSFSLISDIAANPPAHLEDLQHRLPHNLLTLYIVRVPGSRDVFLTPLKPGERVVTAQDVESSLYFVHINDADDFDLLHTDDTADHKIISQARTMTQSKPAPQLPARPVHASSTSEVPPPLPHRGRVRVDPPPLSLRTNRVSRKPLITDITNSSRPAPQHSTLPALPPRPLPALPDENTSSSKPQSSVDHSTEKNIWSPPTPAEALHCEALDGSLTLIRREPSTSYQCNVATIQELPEHTGSFAARTGHGLAARRIKKDGAPLLIDITNPAYSIFDETASFRSSTVRQALDTVFKWKVYPPNAALLDSHETSNQPYSSVVSARDSMMSERPVEENQTEHERRHSSIDMRTRGYTFKSPWHGTCEFTTSASGRSLICRHATGNRLAGEEVSELRFNLPISANGTASAETADRRRQSYFNAGKRRSRIDMLRGHSAVGVPDDAVTNGSHAVDLSLGHEMAGGGFGGRQPKLGKLIVHPAGLAMLDLLVAANIGLWWRAWEKVK